MSDVLKLWWGRNGLDEGQLTLGACHDHYAKSVRYINELEQELKGSIPFDYEVLNEAEVRVFGGGSRKRQVVVTLLVRPRGLSPEEAAAKLKDKGFLRWMDPFLL